MFLVTVKFCVHSFNFNLKIGGQTISISSCSVKLALLFMCHSISMQDGSVLCEEAGTASHRSMFLSTSVIFLQHPFIHSTHSTCCSRAPVQPSHNKCMPKKTKHNNKQVDHDHCKYLEQYVSFLPPLSKHNNN